MITRTHINMGLEGKENRSAINIENTGNLHMVKIIGSDGRLELMLTNEQLKELGFKIGAYLQDIGE